MVRPADEHLRAEELEMLLRHGNAQRPNDAETSPAALAEVRSHLAGCPQCQSRMKIAEQFERGLAGLRQPIGSDAVAACPNENVWVELVAGKLSAPDQENNLRHAAECDDCGAMVRELIRDLETTSEEDAVLENLQSATASWQKELAHRMAATPPAPGAPLKSTSRNLWSTPWVRWAAAAAAAAAVCLAAWFYGLQGRGQSVEQMLARAYTEQRTLKMRIPGAEYAPVRTERGPGRSRLSLPQALLEAEATISKELAKNPNDVRWLQAKARADLLEGNNRAAIESLKQALSVQPDSAALLTDLGAAYFQRAEAEDRGIDYAEAIEVLSQALQRKPDDPIALFNRAIAYEQMFLYDEALQDWQSYFRAELDPRWASEGKARHDALLAKIKRHDKSYTSPSHSAGEFLADLANPPDPLRQPPASDEQYLETATTEWLPTIVGRERAALLALARDLRERHEDRWLADMLQSASSPGFRTGTRLLSSAIQATQSGHAKDALDLAFRAREAFRGAGVAAGESRAALEYLTALNRTEQGGKCLAAVSGALGSPNIEQYSWIHGQILLQASTCYNLRGNPGMAAESAKTAVGVAKRSRYPVQYLSSLYYTDGVTTPWVSSEEAFSRIRSGLGEFWQGNYPPMSAHDFYSDMGFASVASNLSFLGEAAGRESVAMASRTGDLAFEASCHHWLAQVAELAKDWTTADSEFEKAGRAFDKLNARNASDPALVTTEIDRAAIEIRSGNYETGGARLLGIQDRIGSVGNTYSRMLYFLSLGELDLHRGEIKAAESHLLKAIAIIEAGSESLRLEANRLAWQRESLRAYQTLVDLYYHTYHDPTRAWALLERYRAMPLGAVQNYDPPAGQMLTWMSFPSGLAIWLVNRRGVETAWVDVNDQELQDAVDEFVRLCANPNSDRAKIMEKGRQLYDWLIGPLGGKLDASIRLVVEPDQSLSVLPFRALVGQDGTFLGSRFVIVESHGVAFANRLRFRATAVTSNQALLAIGNPLLQIPEGSSFSPLPEADEEAREIAGGFPRRHLLVGKRVTPEDVTRLLPEAEVFHFAGHTLSGSEPGLLLTQAAGHSGAPALLGVHLLNGRQMPRLRLVVLSGCETALAQQGLSDPGSLVRIFMQAGVPQVIASKWNVDSRVTKEMMHSLYARMLKGAPAAAALAEAERQVMANPETSHPYFWSAFSAFGY